jgi:hypothetical protein
MQTQSIESDTFGSGHASIDQRDLERRISQEFREMPGLVLTLAQTARLFSEEPARCERALGLLVERGVLARSGPVFGLRERWPAQEAPASARAVVRLAWQ